MRFHQWLNVSVLLVVAVASLAIAKPASAHVVLDMPNGGEMLEVGSTFTIQWHITHSDFLQNWDLWYSTTGAAGSWIPIATNLPAGSGAVGSVHTYDWEIPDTPSDQVRVRVRMDNLYTDYEDISNANLSIIPATKDCPWDLDGSGSVGTSDLLELFAQWGTAGPADFDESGAVGTSDLLILFANWGPCP
ncbi:MAG: hypothetical protein IH984_13625 [Planctomycetes bacterium]|nr:hypothetical protein [Planctomycetota bacterium]